METRKLASAMHRAAGILLVLASTSPASPPRGEPAEGPDIIIGSLDSVQNYGQVGGIAAFSLGFGACNIGTAAADWAATGPAHPVIAQNLYRIVNGRFEHIGMSWVSHEFCALQLNACANSPDYPGPCEPSGAGCSAALGTGCSTGTTASLAGQQQGLGPRSQVDAFTGGFAFPFTAGAAPATIGRRLQAAASDLDPAQNAGAVYLAEAHIISAADALAGNGLNNASHRRITPGAAGTTLSLSGPVHRQRPAVLGWQDVDPTVTVITLDVPGEGRFHIAANVEDRADGTWGYTYVVHNLNSDLSAASLAVPIGCGAEVTGPGFSSPRSHSGEPYSNDPWTSVLGAAEVVWTTQPESENPDANAVRWGTAATFWFTADSPPAADTDGNYTGVLRLGLFRAGAGSINVPGLPTPAAPCRADWTADGAINSSDIGAYLTSWLDAQMTGDPAPDLDCDGATDSSDISAFLVRWLAAMVGEGC